MNNLLRFKSTVFPGIFVSFSLLSFAFLLFLTLYISDDTNLFTSLGRILGLLKFTVYQAFLSTVLSLLVGVLLAWALSHQSKFKDTFGGTLLIFFSLAYTHRGVWTHRYLWA